MTTALGRMWEQLRPSGPRFENVGAIGEFEVRAEIPGVDPARDIRIRLAADVLRVEVTRGPTRDDQIRSEFHYGQSVATVVVPHDLDGRQLWAAYHRGVLTIASTPPPAAGRPVALGPEPHADVTNRPKVRDFRT